MRLRRTHYALAVMVVATALAADRSVAAAPEVRPTTSATPGLARSLAARITRSFRQTVASTRVTAVRRNESVAAPALAIREDAAGHHAPFPPFAFRLPPPTL